MSTSEIGAAYAAVAERYISMFGSTRHVHPDDLSLIRRHLGSCSGPVLDLGCGPGHLTGFLHGLGVDVTGVDLVDDFISHARHAHPTVRFEVGSLAEVPPPDGGWAGILAWYSLIHVAPGEMDDVLEQLRRVIARNGMLVVGFFQGEQIAAFDHKVLGAYRWPVAEFAQRLVRAGFLEVDRVQRPATEQIRAHAAIAARAV